MKSTPRVIIIGAGLAGLTCALKLHEAGVKFLLLEGSNAIGGRVKTDVYEDYRLDHGFQVLLTAYPEAKSLLDYDALKLHSFYPGAMVRWAGRFHKIGDPFKNPLDALFTAFAPIGDINDKLRVAKLRQRVLSGSLQNLLKKPETTTLEALKAEGFSDAMIDKFFRPFLGGIMLDHDLTPSSRMFDFVFRMFSQGDAAIPAQGMSAIPQQIAKRLPPGSIRTNAKVLSVQDGIVNLPHNETLGAQAIVVATEVREASRLLGDQVPPKPNRSVSCLYYGLKEVPFDEPILVLNGEGKKDGPINNMCILSNVSKSYAPDGYGLVSVSILGAPDEDEMEIEQEVRVQLKEWFPDEAYKWRYLKTYKIENAQPDQSPPALSEVERAVRLRQGLYVCGDHRDTASINGAIASGRRAAEAVLSELPA
ncbi:unnamed protein product [Sphagnum balticum]